MFSEERLPLPISLASSGGPTWQTQVIRMDSGHEQRNRVWAEDLGQWDIGSFVKTEEDVRTILAFFHAMQGRLVGFRFQDPKDAQLVAQTLGTGNGVQATFQLVKTYGSGPAAYTKTLTKPVPGTVLITVGGTPAVEGVAWTVDTTTGVVTFLPGHLPPMGQAVVASCTFDKPVRFDVDVLSLTYDDLVYGTLRLPLMEIRV